MCIVHRLGMLTFLQDKDIGKYNQALAQALDGISAKAAFIKVRKNCRVYPSIVVHIFTRIIKALNVGCCHVVGDLGVQAEAQYLSCNPRGVERPGFEAAEQSLQYRMFVVLPMGDMKRYFFADKNASIRKSVPLRICRCNGAGGGVEG